MDNSNTGSNKSNEGFFKYLFNFDSEQKVFVMNSVQYLLLGFIPLMLLDRIIINHLSSNENLAKKESWKLLGEILLEIIFVFVYIFLVDKIIRYLPTYSGVEMGNLNWIQLIVTLMFFCLPTTNIAGKTEELQHRVEERIFGTEEKTKKRGGKKSVVRVTQPISSNGKPQAMPTHAASRADYISQHQNQIAPNEQMAPTSSGMYGGPSTSLVNADWPPGSNSSGQEGFAEMGAPVQMEPAAANGVLGGSFGSAW